MNEGAMNEGAMDEGAMDEGAMDASQTQSPSQPTAPSSSAADTSPLTQNMAPPTQDTEPSSSRSQVSSAGTPNRTPSKPSPTTGSIPSALSSSAPGAPLAASNRPPGVVQMSSAQIKFAQNAIRSLKARSEARWFLDPVDPVALNIPSYVDVVKEPMDLGTIDFKLSRTLFDRNAEDKGDRPLKPSGKVQQAIARQLNSYPTVASFERDVALVFDNCAKFNGEEHQIAKQGRELQKVFERRMKGMPADKPEPAKKPVEFSDERQSVAGPSGTKKRRRSPPSPDPLADVEMLGTDDDHDARLAEIQAHIARLEAEAASLRSKGVKHKQPPKPTHTATSSPSNKRAKTNSSGEASGSHRAAKKQRRASQPDEVEDTFQEITDQQKEELLSKAEDLPDHLVDGVLRILDEDKTLSVGDEDEVVVDVNGMDPRTLYKLYAYVVGFRSAVGSSGGEAVRSGEQALGGQSPGAEEQHAPQQHPPAEWINSITTQPACWPHIGGSNIMKWDDMDTNAWFSMRTLSLSAPVSVGVDLCEELNRVASLVREEGNRRQPSRPRNRTLPYARAEGPFVTRRERLYPTTEQKEALRKVAGVYRWTFNRAIAYLRQHPHSNLTQVRQATVKSTSIDEQDKEWVFKIPYAIRAQAAEEAHTANRNSQRAQAEGRIDHFTLHFRKRRSGFGGFKLEKRQWKDGTLHIPELLDGPIRVRTPIRSIERDGATVRQQNGKWEVLWSVTAGEEDLPAPAGLGPRVCAIDPGVRTFATLFDPLVGIAIKVGEGANARIFRLGLHLDNLLSRMAASNAKQRYRMRKAANRLRKRIKDLTTDLHKKLASFLRANYDTVFIPTFNAHEMSRRGKRRIGRRTIRQMMSLAHGRFRSWLGWKMKTVEIKEDWTSKTCSTCGRVNYRLGGSDTHRCPSCGTHSDRDVNAAKNIFIHSLFDLRRSLTTTGNGLNTAVVHL